jgi:protein TonB
VGDEVLDRLGMTMSEKEEKKNRLVGILTSVSVHLAVLLVFLFVGGWTPPDPPLSELGSGVELNFGLDQEGQGEVQPTVPAGATEPQPEVTANERASETPPEPKPEIKETDPKPAEDKLTSTDESAVAVPEPKKEVKKPVVTQPVESPKEKPPVVKPKDTPVTEAKKEPSTAKEPTTRTEASTTAKNATGASQGDDKKKGGDKGSPEGTLDPNGQYTGKPGVGGNGGGGGNGFALSMSGWNWDSPPQAPKLPDNENGRIVFEITVDADGEIIQIETLQRGLSPEAERICKQEIQKRSLVRTATSGAAPERSKGRITFILHTQ